MRPHGHRACSTRSGRAGSGSSSTRHEQIAAHAADGYARASGKPGVLLTHLGPGLTNACTGVANAALDSIPMVVIAGDVQSYYHGRHPHQEVNLHQDADQFQIYRPFCKRVYRVDRVARSAAHHGARVPSVAVRAARSGARRRADGYLLRGSAGRRVSADAGARSRGRRSMPAIAERIVDALAAAERPVLYAGGGVLSARATAELAALAEALEVPVAHTLMGKGCLHADHPLLLGQTGFWGTPISNEKCRTADLIVAVGTRLAEANSSSWDSAVHVRDSADAPDSHRCRRSGDRPQLPDRARRRRRREARARRRWPRRRAAGHIAIAAACATRSRAGRQAFAANWDHQWSSDQFPMRPERILAELRKAVPEDGFIVTDVGWNKNGVGQQFPITVPGTFITPSGLATMGFGPAAVLGVKMAHPRSRRRCADRRRRVQHQSVGHRDGDGSRPAGRLAGHGQRRVRHDCRPRGEALRLELRLHVRAVRPAVSRRLCARWRAPSARAA